MRKMLRTIVWSTVCLVALIGIHMQSPAKSFGFEILIDVSPNVLNLQYQGYVVTVHTDIDYDNVDVSTIYLNGVAINSWKEDNRGYFVAKFLVESIRELPLVIGDTNTLKLVGLTTDELAFWGEQDIKVVENIPVGRE